MRLPRDVSPGAAARRSLLIDLIAGIVIGVVVIVVSAGIGVAGFFALIVAIVVLAWYTVEGGLRWRRRRGVKRSRRENDGRPGSRADRRPERPPYSAAPPEDERPA